MSKAIRAALLTAKRYARGGYADQGFVNDAPDMVTDPNESVLMREFQAVTPKSLAKAWTPPEESIAQNVGPRAAQFMQEYPEKLAAGIAAGIAAAPGEIAHSVKDPFVLARQAYEGQLPPDYFHSDEGIGRVVNAAGLVQTSAMPFAANVAKEAAQKGETMLGSAGGTLYHGSPVKDLNELNPSARGPLGPGTYATPDPINIAKRYAGEEGQVYQLPNKEMDIFRGSGHRTDAEYEGFKKDKKRLIDAVEPEMQDKVVPMIEKMWSGDGYPLYWQLRKAYGGDEGAQNLFKRAKFEGLSGQVDGPETVIFKKVPLKTEPQVNANDIGWNQNRINKEINYSHYDDGRSKAMVAFVNPNDFLAATTPSAKAAKGIAKEAGALDLEKLSGESQSPFLKVQDGKIINHEGRHRMAAMAAAGYDRVPVVLDYGKGTSLAPSESLSFKGQHPKSPAIEIQNAIPLNKQYMDEISKIMSERDTRFKQGGMVDPIQNAVKMAKSPHRPLSAFRKG